MKLAKVFMGLVFGKKDDLSSISGEGDRVKKKTGYDSMEQAGMGRGRQKD